MSVLIRICGCLYIISGIWCALQGEAAARFLGYQFTSPSGLAEFFTVYAGLQIGLGIAIIAGAMRPNYLEATTFFTMIFSNVLATTRLISFFIYDSQAHYTLFIVEALIAIIASTAWLKFKRNAFAPKSNRDESLNNRPF